MAVPDYSERELRPGVRYKFPPRISFSAGRKISQRGILPPQRNIKRTFFTLWARSCCVLYIFAIQALYDSCSSVSISIGQAAEKSSVCVANRFWAKSMRFFQSKLAAFSFERRADLRPFPRAMRCARSLSRARCLLGCHAATGNYISFLLLSAATTTDDDQAQTWLSAFLRCLLRAHTHTHGTSDSTQPRLINTKCQ